MPVQEDFDGLELGPDASEAPTDGGTCQACNWRLQKSSTSNKVLFLKLLPKKKKVMPVETINLNGAKGPVEKMYRMFWARKGDLFHLLLALGTILNERVWPKEDEREVRMFASLIYHVTGVTMSAYFASPEDPKNPKVMGKKSKSLKLGDKNTLEADDEVIYGKKRGLFGCFGRTHMVYKAHRRPFNSGLLAGEALVSPFLGGNPPHAKPVADIRDVLIKKSSLPSRASSSSS